MITFLQNSKHQENQTIMFRHLSDMSNKGKRVSDSTPSAQWGCEDQGMARRATWGTWDKGNTPDL